MIITTVFTLQVLEVLFFENLYVTHRKECPTLMKTDCNDRFQEIHTICSEYARKGWSELERIRLFMIKNNITVLDETPLSIAFIPWKAENENTVENNTGLITWNPINCMLAIEYHLDYSFISKADNYSLILKWYLSKWNEEHYLSKGCSIKIYYSKENTKKVIIRVIGRVSPKYTDLKVKYFLLWLHDIMNSEYSNIKNIIEGKCPKSLKDTLKREIKSMLQELSMPVQEGNNDYEKNIGV